MRRLRSFRSAGFSLAVLAGMLVAGLAEAQQRRGPNPEDIFISEDTDDFDPGLPIGAQFPSIRALYQGEEITEIDRFIGDNGAIFIANRSADW